MRFTKVDEVPKRATYHKLKDDLERFIQSGAAVAKIEFHQGEYKSTKVAVGCLKAAVKRHHFNNIEVFKRGDNVYLARKM